MKKGYAMKTVSLKQSLQVMSVFGNNADWDSIPSDIAQVFIDDPQAAGREFTRFLKNRGCVHIVGNHVIDCDTAPFVPQGWRVEEHQKGGQLSWDASKVKLLVKLNEGESYVGGHELRKRLKDEPVLNANVLDYLLARPELVPEEWKSRLVFFWGTIYRDSDAYLYVRYLFWNGERWHWDYYCLNDGWFAYNPAAVRAHS